MDDLALARALHVLAVIHWIGGLAFVTLVLLPLARSQAGVQGAALLKGVQVRFAAQVRVSVPLVGATGFWMVSRMDLWSRFRDPTFWWMDAMVGLWLVFMLMLFIVEPLFHRLVERRLWKQPQDALASISRIHVILLACAALTAGGAVAGAHGLLLP